MVSLNKETDGGKCWGTRPAKTEIDEAKLKGHTTLPRRWCEQVEWLHYIVYKNKRPAWTPMYTSCMICPLILDYWTMSNWNKQTISTNSIKEIFHFFNNIILHRSKLHSSKPFFDSPAQPRICSPQMMVTEIQLGKLNSITANPPECFYPPLAQNLFWPTVCLLLDII